MVIGTTLSLQYIAVYRDSQIKNVESLIDLLLNRISRVDSVRTLCVCVMGPERK